MKPTLLILAAGMASRYGSMKQIDGFGPNGETIIDYSIYDAIKAGFGKVVFIIKEEFVDNFKSIFEPKLNGKIETDYVFQNFDIKQYGVDIEIERAKPWGTAHAVLAARNVVKEPFAVINADDFYGLDAFQKMYTFLTTEANGTTYSMIGYEIGKTLSEHGSVSRGVCKVDASGNLEEIVERTNVYKEFDVIVYEENDHKHPLEFDTRVSMNFWGFTPDIFNISQELFKEFAHAHKDSPKAEFFIPLVGDHLIRAKKADVKVIPTSSQWFGVTYKEDKPIVQESIDQLIKDGTYPDNLWN
ncbi:nucleotidyltransferase [Pedobacter quisquiliarum]|jgi:NDP-sugar pyrophosphorylase family protein|uniref:Nucleotidyltransferase n=1 Tax=Pedobacter quisquiliarum TaxID=1834438 RepID=A0A916U6X4_9SPHI|nr:sugar phosphate nucleotidyltransferase [Pedobacter quisquiliarum]GGC62066.1 nucleotidyltransferase [Pedobacter quisquiliarum]